MGAIVGQLRGRPLGRLSQAEPVNGFLVSDLDAIDEHLLAYLDDEQVLGADGATDAAVRDDAPRGRLGLAALAEDWPDWFHLAPAFVSAYGDADLENLQHHPGPSTAGEDDGYSALTDPDRAYLRALELQVRRVWEAKYRCYGPRQVHKQLRRESYRIARCTVARLMGDIGRRGVERGEKRLTTTPDFWGPPPAGPRRPPFRGRPARRVVAGRHHVRVEMEWLALRVVRVGTCSAEKSSAGRSPTISAPVWSSTRWGWPSGGGI